jgi:hypothetical protein
LTTNECRAWPTRTVRNRSQAYSGQAGDRSGNSRAMEWVRAADQAVMVNGLTIARGRAAQGCRNEPERYRRHRAEARPNSRVSHDGGTPQTSYDPSHPGGFGKGLSG